MVIGPHLSLFCLDRVTAFSGHNFNYLCCCFSLCLLDRERFIVPTAFLREKKEGEGKMRKRKCKSDLYKHVSVFLA